MGIPRFEINIWPSWDSNLRPLGRKIDPSVVFLYTLVRFIRSIHFLYRVKCIGCVPPVSLHAQQLCRDHVGPTTDSTQIHESVNRACANICVSSTVDVHQGDLLLA